MKKSRKGLIAGIGGLVLFIAFFLFLVYGVGELEWLLDSFSFCVVVGLSAAYGFMYCRLEFSIQKFFKGVKTGALYAGVISFLVVLIAILQVLGEQPEVTGYKTAIALIAPLYGLLLSAAARIAEVWLAPSDEDN